jgi:hypothetical protein
MAREEGEKTGLSATNPRRLELGYTNFVECAAAEGVIVASHWSADDGISMTARLFVTGIINNAFKKKKKKEITEGRTGDEILLAYIAELVPILVLIFLSCGRQDDGFSLLSSLSVSLASKQSAVMELLAQHPFSGYVLLW